MTARFGSLVEWGASGEHLLDPVYQIVPQTFRIFEYSTVLGVWSPVARIQAPQVLSCLHLCIKACTIFHVNSRRVHGRKSYKTKIDVFPLT